MFARNFCRKFTFSLKRINALQPTASLLPVRTLLSALYLSKKDYDVFAQSNVQTEELALQTLSLDRCHERGMPVSSLMIDRLIQAVETEEHLRGSLYYLFKFRHSQNNYYLQSWTVFTFVLKCLKLDTNILMEALTNKIQYGIFPNSFMMNAVLDQFIKKEDMQNALKTVSEMFLLETLDNRISQILALRTICLYWEQNCQDTQLTPEFQNLKMKRDISAALLCIGHYLSNPSLTIIANGLLGSIELEHGIAAVFQDPWGPTSSEPGYLDRGIACLNAAEIPVSQQSIDILLECASKNDEILLKAQKAVELASSKNILSNDFELTLNGVSKAIVENLPVYEEQEQKEIKETLNTWKTDRKLLEELEKEILAEFAAAREKHFREIAIEEKAHQMAVETLGYWDLEKGRKDEETDTAQSNENSIYYLREDYVEGAMEDLELVERIRERRSIVSDPVILI